MRTRIELPRKETILNPENNELVKIEGEDFLIVKLEQDVNGNTIEKYYSYLTENRVKKYLDEEKLIIDEILSDMKNIKITISENIINNNGIEVDEL